MGGGGGVVCFTTVFKKWLFKKKTSFLFRSVLFHGSTLCNLENRVSDYLTNTTNFLIYLFVWFTLPHPHLSVLQAPITFDYPILTSNTKKEGFDPCLGQMKLLCDVLFGMGEISFPGFPAFYTNKGLLKKAYPAATPPSSVSTLLLRRICPNTPSINTLCSSL